MPFLHNTLVKSRAAVATGAVLFTLTGPLDAQTSPAAGQISRDLKVASGFKVDLIYSVPKEQGSWVALTFDDKGRLIAGDQYGGLFRLTLPPADRLDAPGVEALKTKITGAHGLLYAFNSLYVMVNESGQRGLWRLRDTNGDDQFEEEKLLRAMKGSGEHGTHSLVLSPDGRSIYFANGNHTDLPAAMEKSRAVAWGEDHVIPRLWDARGHAKGILAPGGYVGRTDPDGTTIELFSLGFRNQFDLAFDANGELFTFDSDMEWDQGTPWYLPTRINHVVDGGDYGWRSGAGRWPAYYVDSLPAVIDIGPGSPTGTTFGTGARFPARYQNALFAADWTFGTLYAIHLTPEGATFRGEKEEFVSGKALPLTDVIVNPRDGALYFALGGRRTGSALYRVTYVGDESTAPKAPPAPTPEAALRHRLEQLHAEGTGPEALALAWPHLAHADRFVRFAARVAIERQPAARWSERALAEKNPQASVEALVALARVGDKTLQPALLTALQRHDFSTTPAALRLPLLRAWQLAFTRMGKPAPDVVAALARRLEPLFPDADPLVNRELVALLVHLDSTALVAKAVPLLKLAEPAENQDAVDRALIARNDSYGGVIRKLLDTRPDRQQIAYAYALRTATAGWTPALRQEFFSWFKTTHDWTGGASFDGFIENIRLTALASSTPDPQERLALAKLSARSAPNYLADAVPPKGPGKAYTVDEAIALVDGRLTGRNFQQGKALYTATACIVCHRFDRRGGGVGPDLTSAGSRYSPRDLLENIISPSLVVSDIYAAEELRLKDGTTVVGRTTFEEGGKRYLATNPFMPQDLTLVNESDIASRSLHPTSQMPPGLIDPLNAEELKDLVAYILSGANPQDKMFAPAQ